MANCYAADELSSTVTGVSKITNGVQMQNLLSSQVKGGLVSIGISIQRTV